MKKTIYVVVSTEVDKRGNACGDSWHEHYSFDAEDAIEAARRLSEDFASRGARCDLYIDGYTVDCEDGASAESAYATWVDEQCCPVADTWLPIEREEDVGNLVDALCEELARIYGADAADEDWRDLVDDNDVKRAVGLIGNAYKSVVETAKPRLDSFAFKARVLRKGLDFTQAQASEATDVPLRTIENWESGTSTPPSYVQTMYLKTLKESN